MKPFRIRVGRVIDFGTVVSLIGIDTVVSLIGIDTVVSLIGIDTVVSLIGIDTETGKPVAVHIDNRPFAAAWPAWRDAGSGQPIEYAAERLTLSLGVAADDQTGASSDE